MEYKHLQQLVPDGQVYINDHMGTVEAELPSGGFKSAHGPGLVELPNGDLLCAWFAGTFEGSADVNVVCARLKKESGRWEDPVTVSHDPERSEQNPSLFLAPDGAVWAMYTSQLGRVSGKDNMQFTSQIRLQKSYDGGSTWSSYETMFPEEGTFARQAIQVLSNGRWIYGNWICTDSPDGLAGDPSAFRISDDQGKSWKIAEIPRSSGRVHPTVVELEEGHLVVFMRSRKADYIYRSDSYDYGDSFSEPEPTVLPNNNSGISAVKLKSGRIAIAYNPTSVAESTSNGAAWPGLRCPVAVALSEDGGRTWPLIRHMELGEGFVGEQNRVNNRQYEYPCIIQGSDERIHLAFAYKTRESIKWMSFTEDDIIGAKRGTSIFNPTSGQV